MSDLSRRKIRRLIQLLETHGCLDVRVECKLKQVRFMCHQVELSDWMPPLRGLAWIQGYLIGTGHKWAKEMKL